MVLYGLADALPLILASRVLSGLGAANVAVAQAEIGARTSAEARTRILGRLGAAISSGLIVGAPLGGFIATRFGGHAVGYVAGAASAIGALVVLVALRATPPTPRPMDEPRPIRFALLREIPALRPYVVIAVVAWMALATLEGTFARLIHAHFGMGQQEFGVLFGYESLLGVGVQTVALAWLTKRFAEGILLRGAYLAQGVGLALNPLAGSFGLPAFAVLVLASTVYALGAGVANPSVNGICSRLTPEGRQGELFGLLQGTRSIGFILGPIVGGRMFDWQPAAPYYLAGCVSVLAAFLVPFTRASGSASPR
jgi:MFS family permease